MIVCRFPLQYVNVPSEEGAFLKKVKDLSKEQCKFVLGLATMALVQVQMGEGILRNSTEFHFEVHNEAENWLLKAFWKDYYGEWDFAELELVDNLPYGELYAFVDGVVVSIIEDDSNKEKVNIGEVYEYGIDE